MVVGSTIALAPFHFGSSLMVALVKGPCFRGRPVVRI